MLQKLKDLARRKQDFAFETTLATETFVPFLRKCQTEDDRIKGESIAISDERGKVKIIPASEITKR